MKGLLVAEETHRKRKGGVRERKVYHALIKNLNEGFRKGSR